MSPPRETGPGDDGFVLLESLITIALITVVMTALTTFFITAMSSTARQRSEQAATQIATTAVETVRGVGAARAIDDRGSATVAAQFGSTLALRPRVAPSLAEMTPAVDTRVAPGRGRDAPLPTERQSRIINGIDYGVDTFVGTCFRSGADRSAADCRRTKRSGDLSYIRAVVVVSWPDRTCTEQLCVFVTTTMLNQQPDPVFDFTSTTPAPLRLDCAGGGQASAVGEAVDRSVLAVEAAPDVAAVAGCAIRGGVPPFTYRITGLPDGLTARPDATVSGTATRQGPSTVRIEITDSFLRTYPTTFVWTVLPRLVVTPLAPQSNTVNVAIPTRTLAATGGAGTPYTWAATGLPPGLRLNATNGRVTGTPTAVGTYTPTFTVTDASGTRTAEYRLGWAIVYPPLQLTNPGDQLNIRLDTVALTLASGGGSGSVVWSDPGGTLPAGLRLEGNRVVGRPTALVVGQRVSLTAVDATAGTSATVEFRWTVDNGALTVGAVERQVSTLDQPISPLTLTVSGGTAPYRWSDTGSTRPPGFSLGADGVFSGRPTSVGDRRVTVTVTDASGRTGEVSFDWLVRPRPTLTSPGDQRNNRGAAVTVGLGGSCANPPCRTESTGARLPDGLSVDPTSARITGTPTTTGRYPGIVFTITDAAGASASTSPIVWTIASAELRFTVPGNLTTTAVTCTNNGCTNSYTDPLDLTALTEGGDGNYRYSLVGDVVNGRLEPNSTITALRVLSYARNRGETTSLTIRVTDGTGASVTGTLVWRVP